MAVISVIIKQPYTLQISKRDYPEIYWKDRSLLAINNLITMVWTGIFLLNAVVFLSLAVAFTIIFSNILTAFGIAFSIIFPLKALAYFATRGFRKFDWSVKVDTEKREGKINWYDR